MDSDGQLIEAYLAGDESALAALVERHIASVYNFVFRFVGAQEAEDVTQEAFVKAWRQMRRFKHGAQFRPWILAIARNAALDRLRKRSDMPFSSLDTEFEPFEETISDTAPLPDELFLREDTAKRLEQALYALPAPYREVVVLHDQEELTFEAIADLVGRPMNTVKSQYRRAIVQLRTALTE